MSDVRVMGRTLVAMMEGVWDLLVFLVLVAVGLVLLNTPAALALVSPLGRGDPTRWLVL
jgi:hypothetical protein